MQDWERAMWWWYVRTKCIVSDGPSILKCVEVEIIQCNCVSFDLFKGYLGKCILFVKNWIFSFFFFLFWKQTIFIPYHVHIPTLNHVPTKSANAKPFINVLSFSPAHIPKIIPIPHFVHSILETRLGQCLPLHQTQSKFRHNIFTQTHSRPRRTLLINHSPSSRGVHCAALRFDMFPVLVQARRAEHQSCSPPYWFCDWHLDAYGRCSKAIRNVVNPTTGEWEYGRRRRSGCVVKILHLITRIHKM